MNKNRKRSIMGDLALVGFLGVNLITLYVIVTDLTYLKFNLVILNFVFFLLVIDYFTSLTAGIVVNMIVLFVYVTTMIYLSFSGMVQLHFYVYFWIIMLPLYSLTLMGFKHSHTQLEVENRQLLEEKEQLQTKDEETGLENIRAFYVQSSIYLKLARRYKLPVTVMAMELAYQSEISRIIGKEKEKQLLRKMGILLKEALRSEDYLFVMNNRPLRVVALLLTDQTGAEIVKERIKKMLGHTQIKEVTQPYDVKLQFKVGYHTVKLEEQMDALKLYEDALKEVHYDV